PRLSHNDVHPFHLTEVNPRQRHRLSHSRCTSSRRGFKLSRHIHPTTHHDEIFPGEHAAMNAVSRLQSWSQEWWGIYLFKKAPKMLPKFPRCSTSEGEKSGQATRLTIKTNPVDPMGAAAREESKSAADAGIHSSLSGLRWRAVSTAKAAGTVPSSSGAAEEPATRVIGP